MKVLVTGVNGQLGYDVLRELKERGYHDVLGVDKAEMDITNREAVFKVVYDFMPNVIIHCGAFTAVDLAEEMKEACYAVNVSGTKYLAKAAKEIGCKLVYLSTDYVFNGSGDIPYSEYDKAEPLSVYGETKYLGEVEVTNFVEKHFIVRISWVFGVNGNNFVKTMLRLGKERSELNIVSDQIGSPTYTYDLAKLLCDLIETNKYGVYHCTNEGFTSWYEFALEIFNQAGLAVKVNPITSDKYPAKAIRPKNSRLSKAKLLSNGFKPLPTWQDALSRYLKEIEVKQ